MSRDIVGRDTLPSFLRDLHVRLERVERRPLGAGGGGGGGGPGVDTRGYSFVQSTAPSPTREGDTWFDTSTGASGGSSWVAINEGTGQLVWVQFAPGLVDAQTTGLVGRRSQTSNGGLVSASTDQTGLVIIFPAVAGRVYKLCASGFVAGTVANDIALLNVYWPGVKALNVPCQVQIAATPAYPIQMSVAGFYVPAVDETVTAQWTLARSAGSGSVQIAASPGAPFNVWIEDMGAGPFV